MDGHDADHGERHVLCLPSAHDAPQDEAAPLSAR